MQVEPKKNWKLISTICTHLISMLMSIIMATIYSVINEWETIYICMIIIRVVTILLFIIGSITVMRAEMSYEHIYTLYSKIIVGNKIYSLIYFIVNKLADPINSTIEVTMVIIGLFHIIIVIRKYGVIL